MADPCTGRVWMDMIQQCKQTYPWVCHLCGQPISPIYATPHRLSFQVDHVIPKSVRIELALVLANLRPSHARCNRWRSDRPLTPALIAEITARFAPAEARPALGFFDI